jgi:hypothetical protein
MADCLPPLRISDAVSELISVLVAVVHGADTNACDQQLPGAVGALAGRVDRKRGRSYEVTRDRRFARQRLTVTVDLGDL